MLKSNFELKWKDFHTLIFDFDGVFTNNKVYVDEIGKEFVKCDRSDGLAFDILRKFLINTLPFNVWITSGWNWTP